MSYDIVVAVFDEKVWNDILVMYLLLKNERNNNDYYFKVDGDWISKQHIKKATQHQHIKKEGRHVNEKIDRIFYDVSDAAEQNVYPSAVKYNF